MPKKGEDYLEIISTVNLPINLSMPYKKGVYFWFQMSGVGYRNSDSSSKKKNEKEE